MSLGGCISPRPSMSARKAQEIVTERLRQYVDFTSEPEIVEALNTIHLAVNENDNLHTDIGEMSRIIRDLNTQLDGRKQAVFG